MASGLRSRTTVLSSGTGTRGVWSGTTPIQITKVPFKFLEKQTTLSSGHPFSRIGRRKKGVKTGEDIGGGFLTQKAFIFPKPNFVKLDSGGGIRYTYEGPMNAKYSIDSAIPSFISSSTTNEMNAYGATCIARTLPTNALSGMGQFIGELRDIPKLPYLAIMNRKAKDFMGLAKAGSKEYLNVQFGWVPFVKDLLDLSKVIEKQDELIAQYDRDSGRNVRRRTTLINTSVTTPVVETLNWPCGQPCVESPCYTHSGTMRSSSTITHRVWFSGAFTYYFESGMDKSTVSKSKDKRASKFNPGGYNAAKMAQRRRQIASKLYGLRLDPYLLYQLYPWSWFADWMTNLGSNIKNIVAFQNDGLVLRYGYVMELKRQTDTYTLSGLGIRTPQPKEIDLTDVATSITKSRVRASPFGFGLNSSTFSARQWSIIAALGISRAPRSLNF